MRWWHSSPADCPAKGLQTAVLHATPDPSSTGEPSGRLGRMLQSSGIEVYEADESRALDWIQRWRFLT